MTIVFSALLIKLVSATTDLLLMVRGCSNGFSLESWKWGSYIMMLL
jgi:hypothetical protein